MQTIQAELTDFKLWLSRQLERLGFEANTWLQALSPLPGDAGFRQYFVFKPSACHEPSSNFIAVFSPPETEQNREFQQIAEHLRSSGVNVPQIFASDIARGYFLLEHMGKYLFFDKLNAGTSDELYGQAFRQLLKIQLSSLEVGEFPPYTQQHLRRELRLFDQWFVAGLLQITLSDSESHGLLHTYATLEQSALAQKQVLVHRDFHSRNIIFRPSGGPGIIDFQGAVVGAMTYDLASLLRDCYIEWPAQQVDKWALQYAKLAQSAGLLPELDEAAFLRDFDLMGLQRHIKVLGIFSRLSLRDNKNRYLGDLPLVIKYVRQVAAKYPDLADFARWFDQRLLPSIQKQPWMKMSGESA